MERSNVRNWFDGIGIGELKRQAQKVSQAVMELEGPGEAWNC